MDKYKIIVKINSETYIEYMDTIEAILEKDWNYEIYGAMQQAEYNNKN